MCNSKSFAIPIDAILRGNTTGPAVVGEWSDGRVIAHFGWLSCGRVVGWVVGSLIGGTTLPSTHYEFERS
jgi:hypothetical protein